MASLPVGALSTGLTQEKSRDWISCQCAKDDLLIAIARGGDWPRDIP